MYLIKSWLLRFMGWAGFGIELPQSHFQEETNYSPVTAKKKRPAASKTQEKPDEKTFLDLLDGLDDSFKTMEMPPIKHNWLAKKDIKAITKIGLYVPTPWQIQTVKTPSLPEKTSLPFIASALIGWGDIDTIDAVHARFAFAIKIPKLPAGVEQIKGTAYQFGLCHQLNEKEHDLKSDMNTFWSYAYVVVRTDGSIAVPSELRRNTTSIPVKHHRKGVGARSIVVSRQWSRPTMFTHDKENQQQYYEWFLTCVFRQIILWWNDRPNQWSVGVRKGDKRVTFSIAQNHTSAYFADRDRVVAVNGTKKKIVHYVRPHVRENGSSVKAHIRGLTEFDWKGFHCHVTAPKFNGNVLTVAPITPVEVLEDDMSDGKYMETCDVAVMLALAEESDTRETA